MSCPEYKRSEFQELIALYAGGDLPEGQISEVEAHLRGCSPCSQLAEELARTRNRLAALRSTGLSDDRLASVRGAVLAQLAEVHSASPEDFVVALPKRRLRPRVRAFALALAAMLTLSLGLAMWWSTRLSNEDLAGHAPPVRIADGAAERVAISPQAAPVSSAGKLPSQPPGPVVAPPSPGVVPAAAAASEPPTITPRPTTPTPMPSLPETAVAQVSAPLPTRGSIRSATVFTPPTFEPYRPTAEIQIVETHNAEDRVAASEQLRIQWVSDDSDLVMYWLVDTEEYTDEISD